MDKWTTRPFDRFDLNYWIYISIGIVRTSNISYAPNIVPLNIP